jgi:hypothetical protein
MCFDEERYHSTFCSVNRTKSKQLFELFSLRLPPLCIFLCVFSISPLIFTLRHLTTHILDSPSKPSKTSIRLHASRPFFSSSFSLSFFNDGRSIPWPCLALGTLPSLRFPFLPTPAPAFFLWLLLLFFVGSGEQIPRPVQCKRRPGK